MKKLAAIAVSIGVILVIVGLVIVGIYGRGADGNIFSFGWSANLGAANAGQDFVPDEYAEVNRINITTGSYSVHLLKSEDGKISVKYVEPQREGVSVTVTNENGVLTVAQTEPEGMHWGWNFGLFTGGNRFIAVYLPQTEQLSKTNVRIESVFSAVYIDGIEVADIYAHTDAGSIKFNEVKATDLDVETKAGSVKCSGVKARNVLLKSDAGSIKANDTECDTLIVNSSAGSVSVSDTDAAVSVKVTVDAGSAKCYVHTQSLAISSSAGSIKFETDASQIDLSSSAGSIKGTVKGKKSDYNITSKTDMGSSNISDQIVPNAVKSLKATVDMGSIKITFEEN